VKIAGVDANAKAEWDRAIAHTLAETGAARGLLVYSNGNATPITFRMTKSDLSYIELKGEPLLTAGTYQEATSAVLRPGAGVTISLTGFDVSGTKHLPVIQLP
jgi:hypothetical protein